VTEAFVVALGRQPRATHSFHGQTGATPTAQISRSAVMTTMLAPPFCRSAMSFAIAATQDRVRLDRDRPDRSRRLGRVSSEYSYINITRWTACQ